MLNYTIDVISKKNITRHFLDIKMQKRILEHCLYDVLLSMLYLSHRERWSFNDRILNCVLGSSFLHTGFIITAIVSVVCFASIWIIALCIVPGVVMQKCRGL